jgi:hypothetical protein
MTTRQTTKRMTYEQVLRTACWSRTAALPT